MSETKKWLIIIVVIFAFLQTGLGGLRDMFGISVLNVSSQHGWHDGIVLMLFAILLAIVMK